MVRLQYWAILFVLGTAGAVIPTTKPSGRANVTDTFAALSRLNLQLSDQSSSSSESFSFQLHFERANRLPVTAVVARSKDKKGIILLSPDHLPFCIINNGFIAAFDPSKGEFVVTDDGQPKFLVRSKKEGASFDLGLSPGADEASFLFDPNSMLAAKDFISGIELQRDPDALVVKTPGTIWTLVLAPSSENYPLKMFRFEQPSKFLVEIQNIQLDKVPSFLKFDKESFSRLGLPFRVGDYNEARSLMIKAIMGERQLVQRRDVLEKFAAATLN